MPDPTYIIFYVADALASADFYATLLGRPAVEKSPGFALFVLDSGVKLGLWTRHTVQPPVAAVGCSSEIGFSVADRDTVETMHVAWRHQGLTIVQTPTDMDFGHTFVALDPDGHRLRVFAPTPR